MRFKSLAALKRSDLTEISLGTLPQSIPMAHYARAKAFTINELVRAVHEQSLEWYGFTLGTRGEPELIADIGLPRNDLNLEHYTTLSGERIAEFQESLPAEVVINGWIHSHGALMYQHFSRTDEENHRAVLDYVAASLRKPVAKREIAVKDLVLLVRGRYTDEDLTKGSVSLVTDVAVTSATLMEAVYGSFCYAVVIGDEGWHHQQILHQLNGVLSGYRERNRKDAPIIPVDTGRVLTRQEISALRDEVEAKIRPDPNPPLETMERM